VGIFEGERERVKETVERGGVWRTGGWQAGATLPVPRSVCFNAPSQHHSTDHSKTDSVTDSAYRRNRPTV
jgi:hypothetical protein